MYQRDSNKNLENQLNWEVFTSDDLVSCTGDSLSGFEGKFGHPKVYLRFSRQLSTISDKAQITSYNNLEPFVICPYCSKKFVYQVK